MRRAVPTLGLVALVATVLPVPALADGSWAKSRPRQEAPAPAAQESPFTLGHVSCSLIPVPAAGEAAPVGTGACPGVRPGGRVLTSVGDCTFNFLFRTPDGTRYIGTAGHCVSPGAASNSDSNPDGNGRVERVWSWGRGPVAKDPAGHRIGEFAYAVVQSPKDFALIRLDPAVEASPEMCHFGAPRGVYTTDTATATPVVLHYYGNGQGIGTVAPARSAVAVGTPDPDHVFAAGLALPGDSGAGVMTADGLAIGVLVTFGLHGIGFEGGPHKTPTPRTLPHADEDGVDLGTLGITRLGPQLARAAEKLGVSLELVTEQ
jgi:hypothetical protein